MEPITAELEELLSIYKKVSKKQLTPNELDAFILTKEKELDRSFVKTGMNDTHLKLLIEELYELKTTLNNE